jgi:hypothetical protein
MGLAVYLEELIAAAGVVRVAVTVESGLVLEVLY